MPQEPKKPVTQAEFLAMSEEEKVAWAKEHVVVPKPRVTQSIVKAKKRRVKALVKQKQRVKKAYEDKENKWWGEGYRQKYNYLYKHNPQFREEVLYGQAVRYFKKRLYKADEWVITYYAEYKKDISKYASTYKLDNGYEEYALGFSVEELRKVLPIGKYIITKLVEKDVLPEPANKGYLLKKKNISEELTGYYTLAEVQIIMAVFLKYWKKYKTFGEENQQKWLRKHWFKTLTDYRNSVII